MPAGDPEPLTQPRLSCRAASGLTRRTQWTGKTSNSSGALSSFILFSPGIMRCCLYKKKERERERVKVPSTQNIGQSGLPVAFVPKKRSLCRKTKADAPGGESRGQEGKAFKCAVSCLGAARWRAPGSRGAGHQKATANEGNDFLILPDRDTFPHCQAANHQKPELHLQSGALLPLLPDWPSHRKPVFHPDPSAERCPGPGW